MFFISSDAHPLTLDDMPVELREPMSRIHARHEKDIRRRRLLVEMRQERDRTCQALGFSNWDSYWSSPDWKRIRRKVLKDADKICLRCGGKATQVHHRSYTVEVLKGNEPGALVAICAGCHEIVHGDQCGNRYSMDEWDAVLFNKEPGTEVALEAVDRNG